MRRYTRPVILIGFIAVATSHLGTTWYMHNVGSRIKANIQSIVDSQAPGLQHLASARAEMHGIQVLLREYLRIETARSSLRRAEIESALERMDGDLDAYDSLTVFPGEHDLRPALAYSREQID